MQETAFATADDEPVPARPGPSRYRSRFGFVLGALAGTALVSVLLAVVLFAGIGGDEPPAGWSAWHPTASDGYAAATQIANHVGPRYKGTDGEQLVLVQAGPLELASTPLSIALRNAQTGGGINVVEGKGVMYTLNGLGAHGSVKKGAASTARLALLKREALELALYTFRYVDDVESVVALLPPKRPRSTRAGTPPPPVQALFFKPGDLRRELDRPLRLTVSGTPPDPKTIEPGEAGAITRMTRPNTFLASFVQGQNAELFLVLDRPTG